MVKVNDFTVKFHHVYLPEINFDKNGNKMSKPIMTKAILLDRDGAKISERVAICSKTDNFVKETRRKIALSRTLLSSPLSKTERKSIWDAYLNRKNG